MRMDVALTAAREELRESKTTSSGDVISEEPLSLELFDALFTGKP